MKKAKKESKENPAREEQTPNEKRVNKTMEAARRLKGSLIVYDPKFLL